MIHTDRLCEIVWPNNQPRQDNYSAMYHSASTLPALEFDRLTFLGTIRPTQVEASPRFSSEVCFHTALVALAGGLSRFPAMELDGRERGALPEGLEV